MKTVCLIFTFLLLPILGFSQVEKNRLEFLSRNGDSVEQVFSLLSLSVYEKFYSGKIDTIFYSVGNIDGDNKLDTISTRLGLVNNEIYVRSVWSNNVKEVLVYEVINPYKWISNDSIFQYESRSNLIVYAIAIKSCLPRFIKSNDSSLKSINKLVGVDVLIYGPPELLKLDYWSVKKQSFIPYYRP